MCINIHPLISKVDVRLLDEKMAHLESEWQRKISALANTHSIFEQLATITGKKGNKYTHALCMLTQVIRGMCVFVQVQ